MPKGQAYGWDGLQLYTAASALVAGPDPYVVVRDTFSFPLFYPMPAVLLFVPLTVLSPIVARVVWTGLGGATLGWAAARRGPSLLIAGAYALAIGTLAAAFVSKWLFPAPITSPAVLEASLAARWPVTLGFVLLPALAMVLSPRPGERQA